MKRIAWILVLAVVCGACNSGSHRTLPATSSASPISPTSRPVRPAVVTTEVPSAGAKSWPHSVVAGFSTPSGAGYWLVYADGSVTGKGDARTYGDATHIALVGAIVGGASTPSGKGYWLAASDGGVFTFGDAHFYGSKSGTHLNGPVFSITPTKTGKGYWLVARDGGVFAFGDAHFYGSASGPHVHVFPIAGFAVGPTESGYQMIARDSFLLNFGNFPLPSSLPERGFDHGVNNVVGLAPTPTKRGEWIVLGDGGVFPLGDAGLLEGPAHFTGPFPAVFSNPTRPGYALVKASGAIVRFGAAPG
jgi:hypothetical protein